MTESGNIDRFDVAIIGGGIVGLAHAWTASERGLRVGLFERTAIAQGASVRNFGMIWPIGQPAGPLHETALKAREHWLRLDSLGVIDVVPCGSIHIAHQTDEYELLEEFCGQGSHDVQMLTAEEVSARSRFANPSGLRGGMWSATECRVDPRTASAKIATWLHETGRATCHFQTTITHIEDQQIRSSDGRVWGADQTVIASGSDLQTLFPDVLQSSGLRLCKLQMLRSVAQPDVPADTPHLASGLTLRHYTSFRACPTLDRLKRRIAEETPELDRYGIHVMASPFPNGEVILGDSHEYDDDITPFDNEEIDRLILRELRKVISLSDWSIQQRWHGIYAKHPTLPVFRDVLPGGVRVCVGTGGAGMTMAFGIAEQTWD